MDILHNAIHMLIPVHAHKHLSHSNSIILGNNNEKFSIYAQNNPVASYNSSKIFF